MLKKTIKKKLNIGIIGLGYVGLPLLSAFAKKKLNVVGFDIDLKKINNLKKGLSYIDHVDFKFLKKIQKHNCVFTNNFERIKDLDFIILCLPTPLTSKNKPDLSYIKDTMNQIEPFLNKGQCLSLESTTYPGTTRELILPYLKKKFNVGKDFFLIYSPEREDPGRKDIELKNIPKVLGGYSKSCQIIGKNFYKIIFRKIVLTESLEIAEFTKIFENIFRAVNISLVNEMKFFSEKININFNDVVKASSTKPFGFMPFYPGPGIGGHCIPIDPLYLTYRAKREGLEMSLIKTSFKVNYKTTKRIPDIIFKNIKKNKPKILIIGLAYKKNVDDIRESPALKIISDLKKKNAYVDYYDPFIKIMPKTRDYLLDMKSIRLNSRSIKKYDGILICTDHDKIDYDLIYKNSSIIFDSRNVFKQVSKKIIRV
tara:strand:- start:1270 stop:2544 length:1275 start_codon:yes stop_codon:yes gene_type:complete